MIKTRVGSKRKIIRQESYESFLTMLNVLGFGDEQVRDLLDQICTDYHKFVTSYRAIEHFCKAARNHRPRDLPIDFARAERSRLTELINRNSGFGGNCMRYQLETLNRKYAGVLRRR